VARLWEPHRFGNAAEIPEFRIKLGGPGKQYRAGQARVVGRASFAAAAGQASLSSSVVSSHRLSGPPDVHMLDEEAPQGLPVAGPGQDLSLVDA
jgi:hypothetical protein